METAETQREREREGERETETDRQTAREEAEVPVTENLDLEGGAHMW